MPRIDRPHPIIRGAFAAAALPPATAFFPAQDADGVLLAGGLETPLEQPRIEVSLPAKDAAETALSLAQHVARREVSAALVYHQPDPGLLASPRHRVEIRLSDISHRESVWRHLAARGLRGMRWLVPPCRHDIWTYAVVQGPITRRDSPGIVELANAQRCSHLVVLGERLPRTSPAGFRGTCEYLVEPAPDPDGTAPTWIDTAAVTFTAHSGALRSAALDLLFGSGRETTVVRSPRPGFLRRRDRTWQDPTALVLAANDRCVVGAGPYATSRTVVVLRPRTRDIDFHVASAR